MNLLLTYLPLRVALFYSLFGGLWILISDRLLQAIVSDPDRLTRLQTFKGWAFVLASALLLYSVLYFELSKRRQAEENTRRHLSELEAVNRISTALRTAHSLEEMLPHLLDETLSVLDTQSGSIWLYNPESRILRQFAARGIFTHVTQEQLGPEEGIAGTVFSTGVSYLSPEFASDPNALESARDQIPKDWGGACIPIRTAHEVVGVLFAAVPLPRKLTPEEVRLLTTLAEIAGNAIHRMSLHVQTERRLQRISALHSTDRAISASLDLSFILDIFLGQVTTQLCIDAAAVLLINPSTQKLVYTGVRGFHIQSLKNKQVSLSTSLAGQAALERSRIEIRDLRLEIESERNSESQIYSLQTEGFVTYFGIPLITKGKVKGVLEVLHRSPLDPDGEWLDFLETLAGQAAIAIDNASLFEGLQSSNFQLSLAYDTTLEGWSRALELRDQETEGHTQRVVDMTLRMAHMIGFSEADLIHIRRGTLLHDIGKMGIPDRILLKPGPLTEEEWRVMRRHPVYAYQLLSPIAYLNPVLDIPYCHHEKWDGSGYPQGLRGDEIPLSARIFSLVDVWDALCSNRPYRSAWPKDQVAAYIRGQIGAHFDPQLALIFLEMATKVDLNEEK